MRQRPAFIRPASLPARAFHVAPRLVVLLLCALAVALAHRPAAAESANSLAVDARLAWNEAETASDPVRRLRLLRLAVGNFRTILADYRDSDRAVEVVADETVAGLVPSQVQARVAALEARLPGCGTRAVRPCLLARAEERIDAARAGLARNRALFALARYHVAAGFPQRSADALRRIDWDQAPPDGLQRLIQPLLTDNRIETALTLAEAVALGDPREDLLAAIADHQAQKWYLSDAVETAQRIASPSRRGTALSGVALRRAEGGDVEGADSLFRTLYGEDPNWMPAMSAVGLAKAGKVTEALDRRTRIRDPFPMAWVTGHVATAYAKQGKADEAVDFFNRAEDLANSVPSAAQRIWLFQDLALAKKSAGFLEPARQMLVRAVHGFVPESRGAGRAAMADGLVDAAQRLGEPAELLGLGVSTAPAETQRVDALEALTKALINRDALEDALSLATSALKAARENDAVPVEQEQRLLATIAELQARGGDFEGALEKLQDLTEPARTDRVLAAVARARAAAGRTGDALMTTIGIEDRATQAQAYIEIAEALLTSGRETGGAEQQ